MTGAPDFAAALRNRLWAAAPSDPMVPQAELCAMIDAGASHRAVAAALRVLWRAALPGANAGSAACRRWPGSIVLAALACDLAPGDRDALARLTERMARAGAREQERALTLARVHLRADDRVSARAALAQLPADADAARGLRARLAMAEGAFDDAAADVAALRQGGEGLAARLVWLQRGAAALDAHVAGISAPGPELCAELFDIRLHERDFAAAAQVLAWWQAARPDPDSARASEVLALARDPARAAPLLAARLRAVPASDWPARDHVLWLRAGLAAGQSPAALDAHARAALRLHPRQAGLLHPALQVAEAAHDWRALAVRPCDARTPEHALALAQACLRRAEPGRAAAILSRAARHAAGPIRVRLQAARAEVLLHAGRPQAAAASLSRQDGAPSTAPEHADHALLRAEIALWQGDPTAGLAALHPLESGFPNRMPLWLLASRLHVAACNPLAAKDALARFATLKHAQTGTEPGLDPGALMVADALRPGAADGPAAAAQMLRVRAWPFVPQTPQAAAIPQRIAHYWEGPESPALARALRRWGMLHPGFSLTLFDAASAEAWLRRDLGQSEARRFAALPSPALRADLFRLCLILTEGGIFADLDEYPRRPVTPWLKDARVVLCVERGYGTVANNFLAASPGQAVLARALGHVRAALDGAAAPYAWWHSGPAQLTRALAAEPDPPARGLRLLSPAAYCRVVSTNLPWPHKRGPDHWRNAGAVDSDGAFS